MPFIGAATAHLAINRSTEIAGKRFDVIEFEYTGNDIIQAFTKVHGTAPQIVEVNEEAWNEQYNKGFFDSLAAAVKKNFADGTFKWEGRESESTRMECHASRRPLERDQ